MIGQKRIQSELMQLSDANKFPRFSIITGSCGSGKKTLCRLIGSKMFGIIVMIPDIKVETIRNMILNSYKVTTPTLYVIPDADAMSLGAKNSLLKVTEEPPNNAYFIMTLENIDNTLPTIKSRAFCFYLDPYSEQELDFYYETVSSKMPHLKIMHKLAETPGEINYLMQAGPDKFLEYVEKVVDNIAVVNGSNAFKIAKDISLKDSDAGYDLRMFWKSFSIVCFDRYKEDPDQKYADGIALTNKFMRKLTIKSINKTMLFDAWILAIRRLWFE